MSKIRALEIDVYIGKSADDFEDLSPICSMETIIILASKE